ncbi:peptidoglycan DD-metalloendopeptidase family protein [Paenibacillus sp. GYB006]|uniref:peptidoglycan DD-metalloendopeptidase family protein n=1 Tax=Paenibacillus sp. GYB006 TaxID=2994394 RepID=UPI002F961BF2
MKKFTILGGLALIPILLIGSLFALMLMVMMFSSSDSEGNYGGGGWGSGIISSLGESEIPAEYIPIYQAAAEKFGVPWNLLAAVHRIETRFSTLDPMISSVGAEGHFQFMPCTFIGWGHSSCSGSGAGNFSDEEKTSLDLISKYGGYGVDANGDGRADMWDLEDAVFSAANYLGKSGAASGNIEKALYQYNHSQEYVSEVMKYATLYVTEGYDAIIIPEPGKSGFSRPVNGQVTSEFGPRTHPVTGEVGKPHEGVDFACSYGQPIPASKAGTVIMAGWQNASNPNEGYGQYVRVDHGGGYVTIYAHLSSIKARAGDQVSAGTVLGGCGSTGSSTGNHLHFEIIINGLKVNPLLFVGG